jgi:AAA ATPase domain
METRLAAPKGRARLRGRADECGLLNELLADARRGVGRSLLLRGEAGIGKTALLQYLIESASEMTVLRAVGVESEMELAYASLHQLCAPLLDRLEMLPPPQRDALRVVFGLTGGAPPDRFLVGPGLLSLLSAVAEERPLLCVVDDAQWLDHASAVTLAFVARRLLAERVGMVFAAREPGGDLRHLSGGGTKLHRAVRAIVEGKIAVAEGLRWGWLVSTATWTLWDEESSNQLLARQLQALREGGLLVHLPIYLQEVGANAAWRGDFASAASLIAEGDAVAEATGTRLTRYAAVILAAYVGDEAESSALIEAEASRASAPARIWGSRYASGHLRFCTTVLATTNRPLSRRGAPARWSRRWAHARGHALSWLRRPLGRERPSFLARRWRGRGGERRRQRLGVGGPRPLAGAAQRRGRRRGVVSRADRATEPHPPSSRAGPGAPAVRRVVAPRKPPARRARATAHRTRAVHHDRDEGVRRARACRAAGNR